MFEFRTTVLSDMSRYTQQKRTATSIIPYVFSMIPYYQVQFRRKLHLNIDDKIIIQCEIVYTIWNTKKKKRAKIAMDFESVASRTQTKPLDFLFSRIYSKMSAIIICWSYTQYACNKHNSIMKPKCGLLLQSFQ